MWKTKKTTLTDANSDNATQISDLSGHFDDKGNDFAADKQASGAESSGNLEPMPIGKDGEPQFMQTTAERGIVEKAKANGTHMKAQNGKPTKLSENQWAQTRTKAFKEWFGDWDLAATEMPIVEGDLKFKNDAEIISYMKEHFMDEEANGNRKWRSFTNLYSGNTLTLSSTGINKSLSKKAKNQSASEGAQRTALSRIDEIIANSMNQWKNSRDRDFYH